MLKINIQNHIATITLNRPEIHNAFDDNLIKQLSENLCIINEDQNIRAVILKAEGKHFCSGADLNWMQRVAKYSHEENIQDAYVLSNLLKTLNTLNKPTIALVQGVVFGGGLGLVAACDIAIAEVNAQFCFSEVKIGLIPAVISPYCIAAIGERAARRYFLTGEKFSVKEALRLNLIHHIVPMHELEKAGLELAETLLKNSPQAVTKAKKLIAEVQHETSNSRLLYLTAEWIADIRTSPEGQEGINAFLEKRKPRWQIEN